jgi:WD40 repeat protein
MHNVSRIFLSHSSRDNRQAIALVQWLSDVRPELATEIFLDVSAETGLRPGQRWKEALRQANDRCEAVICLLSHNWERSPNCKTEYLTAENLGKQILVARLEDVGDTDITSEWQRCDLFADGAQSQIAVSGGPPVRFNTGALDRLKKAIEGTEIGPENFAWPPKDDRQRAPYRGWEPFQDIDAGVFFGRDAAIVRGMDELRAMRLSRLKSLFVVLGPSGSGKSSFLRAGLIPRLQRDDRQFRVLGVLRPERNPLTGAQGFAAAIHTGRQALHLTGAPLGEIKTACLHDASRVAALLDEMRATATKRLVDAGHDRAAPTLILPLDQAEELFSADASAEADQFLALIAELIRGLNSGEGGLILAVTIRTDRYEEMQKHPALDRIGTEIFSELKPMPAGHFSQVITEPAARARRAGQQLTFDPNLVNQLLADATEGADTLPLLALTLARLYADYSTSGELTLADYEAMGGMRHIVRSTIDQVLATDVEERDEQLKLLRAAFIPWLVSVNPGNDEPMRRLARYGDLPEGSGALIKVLVENRLLVRDERDGQVVVEVALESLLRQWDDLADWLSEERQNLKDADYLERSTAAWDAHGRDDAWLLQGTRLTDAEALAAKPGYNERLAATRSYVAASRRFEQQRLADELRAAAVIKRSRILQVLLTLTAIIAVVAAMGFVQANTARHQAQERFRFATSLRLVSEALAILDDARPGGDARAFQQILAARRLAATPDDGALYSAVIKKLTTRKIIETPDTPSSVALSPDGYRIASAGATVIQVRRADTGHPIGQPIRSTHTLTSVAFSPDGHNLAASDATGMVTSWNLDTGQPIGQPFSPQQGVTAVAFSPDGRRLAVIAGQTISLWDVGTGRPLPGLPIRTPDSVTSIAVSLDGRELATGNEHGSIQLWDVGSGAPIGDPMTGHSDAVTGVAFSFDGHNLASGGADDTIRLWDIASRTPVGDPLIGHTNIVTSVAFSSTGQLVSSSADHTIRLWDLVRGRPLTGDTDVVTSVTFGPDGRRIASGSLDDTIRLWDVVNRTPIGAPLIAHQGGITSVALSLDGHRIVSGGLDGTVRFFDADSGRSIAAFETNDTGAINSVAASPNGHRIVSGGDNTTLRIWDANTGQVISTLRGHTAEVFSVAFTPDGRRIASGSADGTIRIWNVDSHEPIAALIGHIGKVISVAFSPDGHRLASASTDRTIRLWDPDTGMQIGQPLSASDLGPLESVAFSPDGRHLASGSANSTIRLWDVDARQQIGDPLTGHRGAIRGLAFSPDGQRLASAGADNTLRLWPAGAGPSDLCKKLTANMSHKQWHDWVSPDMSYITVCAGLPIAPD